jgi:GPH family glycoside/pentoside/hexuronide:cation symporter
MDAPLDMPADALNGARPPPPARPPITPRVRWLYGAGSAAFGVKDNGFSYFLLFYYNQVLGLPGTYAGLAILIAMIFDAIADPVVGVWSDNTRSRWGRRHPFMYASAFPVAFTYFFLWNPPELGEFALFVYLTVASVLVRIFITLYELPSSAIVAELTDDYDERTRMLGYRYMLGWYGGLAMAVLNWGVLMVIWGAGSETTYRIYGSIGAVVILLTILGSTWGLHSYIPYLQSPPSRERFTPRDLARELKQSLANRNFAALFFAGLFAAIGAGVATNFDAYIVTQFWEFSPELWRWVICSLFIAAVLPLWFTPRLTARWDKKRTAMGVYAFQIVFAALPVFLRLAGWFPDNQSPWLFPIIWVHSIVNVAVIVSFGIVQSSMLADVVEHSQMSTGRREEGLFFASRSFAQKATSGIGAFVAGMALDAISFPKGAAPGTVDPDTIWQLGFIYGPVLMVFYLLALASMGFYRITRHGHVERVEVLRGERAAADVAD